MVMYSDSRFYLWFSGNFRSKFSAFFYKKNRLLIKMRPIATEINLNVQRKEDFTNRMA